MLFALFRRLLLSIPLLFGVSALTFVLAALTPGDPGRTLLGVRATPDAVAHIDQQLGLNRPVYRQYWSWLSSAFKGDLGRSLFTSEPVTQIIRETLPVTLTLIVGATLLAMLVGIPLGVASARRQGAGGKTVNVVSMAGFAIPTFWLGLILVLVFSTTLPLFPASGWVDFSVSPTHWLRSLTLPLLTLAAGGASILAKQTRDGMAEALSREYIRALRSRGVSERSVIYRHALRNALPNVATVVGVYFVSLLLGTTLVESVFALHGLGSEAVTATNQHDLPILEGTALVFTFMVVITFALVDLARAWLNPKLRHQR